MTQQPTPPKPLETEEIYIDSPQPPARPKRVIWPYAVAAGVLAAGGLALWWSKAPAPEVQSVPAPVYTQPLKVPATRPASEASPGRSAGPSADKSPAPAKPVTKAESVAPTTSEEVVADPFVRTANAPTPSSSVVAAPPSTLPGSTPRRADLNAQPALPIQRPVQHVTAPVQVVPAPDMPVIQIQPPRPVTPAELVQAAPSPSVVPAERSTERALPPISVVPRIRIQPPDAPASPTATPKVTPPPDLPACDLPAQSVADRQRHFLCGTGQQRRVKHGCFQYCLRSDLRRRGSGHSGHRNTCLKGQQDRSHARPWHGKTDP